MVAEPVVSLFARVPRRGEVKTRLIPAVGIDGATALHTAMLKDSLDRLRARAAAGHPCDVWFDVSPPKAWIRAVETRELRWRTQVGADLGERMAHAVREALQVGRRAAVIWGADSPTLPAPLLQDLLDGVATQRGAGAVPAADGGFVAFAAAFDPSALFRGTAWGGAQVLRATREAATLEARPWFETPGWYDLDRAEDLERLMRESAGEGAAHEAPLTLAACERWLRG